MFDVGLNEHQARVDKLQLAALCGLMLLGAAFVYSATTVGAAAESALDHYRLVVQTGNAAHDRSVVGERVIDNDIRTPAPGFTGQVFEDVRQLSEPELGGSTTAARVLGHTDRCLGFWGHGRHGTTTWIPRRASTRSGPRERDRP